MLRWLTIGAVAVLAVLGGCLMHSSLSPKTVEAGGVDSNQPFAVRWTDEPLGRLSEPSIKVCKATGVLTVFDGNEPAKSYRVITGANFGDKQVEGDKRTPEGMFRVVVRNPKSKYVLSLGLDYPNVEDAKRGLRDELISRKQYEAIVDAIGRGKQPPWNTRLGGEIMIHGAKGKRTGTLGCVSMDNKAIRELYRRIGYGVEVEIVP